MLNLRRMTKVHTENTGDERNWHKDSGDDGELFHEEASFFSFATIFHHTRPLMLPLPTSSPFSLINSRSSYERFGGKEELLNWYVRFTPILYARVFIDSHVRLGKALRIVSWSEE
jgi:hypothetical protein